MVYIIVLNFNNPDITIECLESIKCLLFEEYQIILVDNASNDNSVEIFNQYLKRNKNIIFLEAEKNLGYASGNNIALKYALERKDMKYCWILNNDTIVDKNALSKLYEFMECHDEIGICGSKLIYDWDRSKIQGYGGFYDPVLSSPSICKDIGMINNIDYVIGASVFIRREFLQDIGLMCEEYFLYYEELDWAERAKGKYKISCVPESVVYHKEGASMGSGNDISYYYLWRSRLLFAKKFNKKYFPILYLIMIYRVFKNIILGRYKRVWMNIKLMFKVQFL